MPSFVNGGLPASGGKISVIGWQPSVRLLSDRNGFDVTNSDTPLSPSVQLRFKLGTTIDPITVAPQKIARGYRHVEICPFEREKGEGHAVEETLLK